MDDNLRDVRLKIADLRTAMAAAESQMRKQIVGNVDASEISAQLLGMRKELVVLINRRDALGGAEMPLPYNERFVATLGRSRAD